MFEWSKRRSISWVLGPTTDPGDRDALTPNSIVGGDRENRDRGPARFSAREPGPPGRYPPPTPPGTSPRASQPRSFGFTASGTRVATAAPARSTSAADRVRSMTVPDAGTRSRGSCGRPTSVGAAHLCPRLTCCPAHLTVPGSPSPSSTAPSPDRSFTADPRRTADPAHRGPLAVSRTRAGMPRAPVRRTVARAWPGGRRSPRANVRPTAASSSADLRERRQWCLTHGRAGQRPARRGIGVPARADPNNAVTPVGEVECEHRTVRSGRADRSGAGLTGSYGRRLGLPMSTATRVPRHVGVMLDGNRRWARALGRTQTRSTGGGPAADRIRDLSSSWCDEVGVEVVTLWLLSTENLSR